MDAIAHYLGQPSWEKLMGVQPSDSDWVEKAVCADEIRIGSIIEAEWLPDRKLQLLCIGENHFRVAESRNGKLLVGDEICIHALGKIMQQFHLAKDSVIKRCLKEDPKERFQSIEALKTALRPKRWPFVVLAAIILGALSLTLSIAIRQNETVFIPEPKSELTLDDSLALFKEELQNALAPTFYNWYGELNRSLTAAVDKFSWSETEGAMIPARFVILEALDDEKDKLLAISRGIVKEKTNKLHLSAAVEPQYEKVAQEVIDYYLEDYWKLKEQLEKERDEYQ